MKELDVVRLTKEFEGLAIGTRGTIVLEYDGKFFEVEFFDDDGNTIDVFTTPTALNLKESFKTEYYIRASHTRGSNYYRLLKKTDRL